MFLEAMFSKFDNFLKIFISLRSDEHPLRQGVVLQINEELCEVLELSQTVRRRVGVVDDCGTSAKLSSRIKTV